MDVCELQRLVTLKGECKDIQDIRIKCLKVARDDMYEWMSDTRQMWRCAGELAAMHIIRWQVWFLGRYHS